jgi:hypothetical protein
MSVLSWIKFSLRSVLHTLPTSLWVRLCGGDEIKYCPANKAVSSSRTDSCTCIPKMLAKCVPGPFQRRGHSRGWSVVDLRSCISFQIPATPSSDASATRNGWREPWCWKVPDSCMMWGRVTLLQGVSNYTQKFGVKRSFNAQHQW